MTEAVIIGNAVVRTVVQKPVNQAYEVLKSALMDLTSDLKSLQNTRTIIEAVLLDADSLMECSRSEEKSSENLSCQLDMLLDLLDLRETMTKQKEVMGGSRFMKEARLFFSASNQLVAKFTDARKVKTIRNNLDSIARDHAQFGAIFKMPSGSQTLLRSTETTWSHIITDVVVGRDGDRDKIIGKLCNDSVASETLSVTSIVGIGGMGKTTLARYVYHDERVKSCFDVQFWVTTAEEFDINKVLVKVLASGTNQMPLQCNIDQLYHHFQEAIKKKKFLLVLDNIWDQDSLREKWLVLRCMLSLGANKSKVLLTTRSQVVAGLMDSVDPYMLRDLTKHDSWLIFEKIAFTQWQEPGVRAIGHEILEMCPNVPLVIRSIGGLLAGKHTVQEWQAFRKDQLANFSSYGRGIIQILKHSYDQLDKRLKLCVAYCSLFPKGFKYDKDELIRLWFSLGYVEPQYSNQSLEEAGEVYVLSLVNCGFFQFEGMTGLIMHDLMHDLVLSIAGFKYKMADLDTEEFDARVRHVSFCTLSNTSWKVPFSFFKIEHLQSFLLTVPWGRKKMLKNLSICDRLISRFSYLRVLDLHDLGIKNVPRSFRELRCLRYLNLSWNPIVKLPNSITRLINLLSLDLSWCYKLEKLPKDMRKLENLRHIYVSGCEELSHMPKGMGSLTDLRTLDLFIVREQKLRHGFKSKFVGELSELSSLKNLTGWLKIRVLRRSSLDAVIKCSLCRTINLKSMDRLMGLQLEFKHGSAKDDWFMLENLQLNANLRELEIEGYAAERLPSRVRDQLHIWLPNLVKLWIYKCEGFTCLGSFWRLPRLENLLLGKLDNVEYIEESCGESIANINMIVNEPWHHALPLFPSLKTLMLVNIPKLKGWQRIVSNCEQDSRSPVLYNHLQPKQAFPILKGMWVDNMEMLTSITREFRGFFSLEELTIGKCDNVQVIPDCIAKLSNLKRLTLKKCSRELKERCQKPTGEDWPKIQHISKILFI